MDTSAKKILETATINTLHAQGFSRASTQANLVLSDVLSRYLAHLAATVAKYAEHAGRRTIVPMDAFEALGEMGTSVEELEDYCATEARDMARYATHSTKRVEDLNDFRAQLAIGLNHDEDDRIPLAWAQVPDALPSEEEDESEDDELETPMDQVAAADVAMVDADDLDAEGEEDEPIEEQTDDLLKESITRKRPTPPLPLSPISNPSTPPPRKRQRTTNWQRPEYVPDWLPPFPTGEPPRAASPSTGAAPTGLSGSAVKMERAPTPPLQAQVSTASSSADYHTVVPYEESSLAALPIRHLPQPPDSFEAFPSESRLPPLQIQQAMFGAYHHVLTNPPPARSSAVNPGRYRVALAFVHQSEKYNRWDAPTTLFGGTAPNPPRVAVMPPSHPIPIAKGPGAGSGPGTPDGSGKEKGEKEEGRTMWPPLHMNSIAPQERITPSLSQPGSRIPRLARDVLSSAVYTRTVRITHPPVLQRGNQKLTYGPGVNAPWNSALSPMPAVTPGTAKGKEGGANGMVNGKDKDKDKEGARPLRDARLYATWNYEPKKYDEPLPVRRRVGSMSMHGGTVPMGRARSESTNA